MVFGRLPSVSILHHDGIRPANSSSADILHLDSSGRPARTFLAEAWFVNAIGFAVPAGTSAAVAVLAWRAHHFYSVALSNYSTLDAALTGLEKA
jgi:hypothetical protein